MNERPYPTMQKANQWNAFPPRIMIVASEEPFDVPRIISLAEICRQMGPTEIIGVNTNPGKPTREYDGTLCVERISIESSYMPSSRARLFLLALYRSCKRLFNQPSKVGSIPKQKFLTPSRRLFASIILNPITEALYQRIRATSVIPRLVICFGLDGLAAGARMKRLYGCPIIFDDQGSGFAEQRALNSLYYTIRVVAQRRFFQFVDVIISGSLVLEDYRRYGVSRVLRIPELTSADKEYERLIRYYYGLEGNHRGSD